jgi:hypothetical protein
MSFIRLALLIFGQFQRDGAEKGHIEEGKGLLAREKIYTHTITLIWVC